MRTSTSLRPPSALIPKLTTSSLSLSAAIMGIVALTNFTVFAHDERVCGGPGGFRLVCGYALEPHHTAWAIAQTTRQYDLFIALACVALLSFLSAIIPQRWLAVLGFLAACVWTGAILNFFLNYTPADRDQSIYLAMGLMIASAAIFLALNLIRLRRGAPIPHQIVGTAES